MRWNPLRHLRRRWQVAAYLIISFCLAINALAFVHARAMTHFAPLGVRPPKPAEMTGLQNVKAVLLGITIPRPTNDFTPAKLALPFETHHFTTCDGVDLEAWRIPRDNPRGLVICFHGFMNSKAGELREANEFRNLGFETMLVDFRGGGGSQGNETTIGYRESLDVTASVEYAQQHFHPARVILYGQSMGSAAILRAIAVDDVKQDAIIIECPYDRLLNTVANRFTTMGLPSFPGARLMLFWGSVQQGYWAFSMNPADYATHVTCPALYIRGEDDHWVTASEAQSLFNNLRGNKTLLTVPHAGHEGSYPRDKEKWTQAVAEFLK